MLGDVAIAVPLAWQSIGYLIFGGVAAAGLFLALASYSRVETVTGVIIPDKGVAAIIPSRAGVIAALAVRDGQIVANVSGHRMGTAEIESALVAHAKVAEAAVVGFPHEIKGQGIYAYVTLNVGEAESPEMQAELVKWVRQEIGPIATPDVIHFTPALPKTRSGKIMRRILRKIAEGDVSNLGDTSTLADPSVVDALVSARP